ncbi:MAG: substrate-binding domain-containing protein [Deltaproteobacteria bacterium]|nr:substrate-binding domain-containing protein [Deltaproteobacteria bacterium]
MRCFGEFLLCLMLAIGRSQSVFAEILRVCADPNNLPFSNSQGQGFENHIAELIAEDLGARVSYTWWAQRRGYVRHTIRAGDCDIWMGVADGVDMLSTTQPYYRSTYVFVTRANRHLNISSLDDPRLRSLLIGVQMVGDDATNTPPAHALARRGIINNVRGYMLYGDYNRPDPQRRIIDAVASGALDIAIVWGPIAGYFATKEPQAINITAVDPGADSETWPMAFNISMGVKHGNLAFKERIQKALNDKHYAILTVLSAYHVPVVSAPVHEIRANAQRQGLDTLNN